MKKAAIQTVVLAVLLLLVCIACRLGTHDTYMAGISVRGLDIPPEDLRISEETPGVITRGTPRERNGWIRIPVSPVRQGETYVEVNDASGRDVTLMHFRVGRFGTIYDTSTGGFTGDSVALSAFTVFCLLVGAIMFWTFHSAKGPAFYAYSTIYAAGFSLFALVTGITMLILTVRHIATPYEFAMLNAYSAISSAGWQFMLLTSPFLLVFATAMAVSNIALLRHERFRVQNVLGIGIAIALVLGWGLAFLLHSRDFSGSEWDGRLWNTLCNVYSTAFAYFECMLIGAIVCGVKAAKHVPDVSADYILILGCRFRRDGTLPPLLRGRVDKAIEYWRSRTGGQAVLVPSGGRGSDEPMAEAEAMKRYLLAQGVPGDRILAEDQSKNTYQNMAYSKALIDARTPGAQVVYATTNYHVFRSGVWASLAGLPAEGMGSRTKWWYWPNAFLRECAGLLMNRIVQEFLLLAAMIVFFGALSMALG